jgi:hypothetical protein
MTRFLDENSNAELFSETSKKRTHNFLCGVYLFDVPFS